MLLLNAVIVCCIIVVNAEPPFNSYSLGGDNNGYDYSNTVNNNGYLGSSYQNDGSFYSAADASNKLSSHIGSHPLINHGINHGSAVGDAGNAYGKYPANDRESEYAGYSKTYESPDSGDSYNAATHVASVAFGAYAGTGNNRDSMFNAYSGVHKDSDFGQYVADSGGSGQRIASSYPVYSRPTTALDNYSEGTADSDVQEYTRGSSVATPGHAESDRAIYPPYNNGGPISEHSFGKQKNSLYNLKVSNKYNDIFSIPSETRYTRGHAMSHGRDVAPYLSSGSSSTRLSKLHGGVSAIYSPGKSHKYYKYLSRYAPNSGVAYLSRERDGHRVAHGKGNGKVIIIKDSRPSYVVGGGGHVYSDEPLYYAAGGGGGANVYRSKSGGYSVSPNFDGYNGADGNYNNGQIMLRRYRTAGGNTIVQKTVFP